MTCESVRRKGREPQSKKIRQRSGHSGRDWEKARIPKALSRKKGRTQKVRSERSPHPASVRQAQDEGGEEKKKGGVHCRSTKESRGHSIQGIYASRKTSGDERSGGKMLMEEKKKSRFSSSNAGEMQGGST